MFSMILIRLRSQFEMFYCPGGSEPGRTSLWGGCCSLNMWVMFSRSSPLCLKGQRSATGTPNLQVFVVMDRKCIVQVVRTG